jgi:glycosyltransferase involved in cell wall biosynthesis
MKSLPHQKVLDVIKRSHVGLLPSYAETYGYSILEAQAAACPAITTNVRAFPEINNEDVGWIINVQKDEKEDALMWPRQEKERTSLILRRELVRIIGEIVDSPSLIREKGIRALARIREDHAPYKRAATMAAIYDSALGIAQTSIHSLGSPTP